MVDTQSAGLETALLFACFHGCLPAVRALLLAGADTELADICKASPLHLAVNGAGCPAPRCPIEVQRSALGDL